jgi:hypothetical protein
MILSGRQYSRDLAKLKHVLRNAAPQPNAQCETAARLREFGLVAGHGVRLATRIGTGVGA